MIVIVAEVQNDHAALQHVVAINGTQEAMGPGHHPLSCNYCGKICAFVVEVGMGAFMCRSCRTQVDVATRSGVFTFWELLDFNLLRPASSASGAPVAVSVCPAPWSGLSRPEGQPWWQQGDKFWNRDKRMGDGLPVGLAWCRDQVWEWLKKTHPDERWILKP